MNQIVSISIEHAGEEWLGDALRRAMDAAPGRLAEPLPAYAERKVINGLHVCRSEGSEGDVLVRSSKGEGNVLFCGTGSRFCGKSGLRLNITGSNNVIFIGPHSVVAGVELDIKGDNNVFYFGAFSSVGNMVADLQQSLTANVRGRGGKIVIGDHCMLATRIILANSDGHAIYDRATGQRLNDDSDIFLDDHVWIARDVRINKGVTIGRDVVVGQGSIVAGTLQEACIYAGIPAKIRREGVTWSRMSCDSLDDMEASGRHKKFLAKVDALKERIARLSAGAVQRLTLATLALTDTAEFLDMAWWSEAMVGRFV